LEIKSGKEKKCPSVVFVESSTKDMAIMHCQLIMEDAVIVAMKQ
jgi:hypothetical protein